MNGAIYTPEEIGAKVVINGSGTMTVIEEALPAEAHPAVATKQTASAERPISNDEAYFACGIYKQLGLDVKCRDKAVHATAMAAVSMALNLEPVITRWSDLTSVSSNNIWH